MMIHRPPVPLVIVPPDVGPKAEYRTRIDQNLCEDVQHRVMDLPRRRQEQRDVRHHHSAQQ